MCHLIFTTTLRQGDVLWRFVTEKKQAPRGEITIIIAQIPGKIINIITYCASLICTVTL